MDCFGVSVFSAGRSADDGVVEGRNEKRTLFFAF